MKKLLSLSLSLFLLLCLVGCGNGDLRIEDHTWTLRVALRAEGDQAVAVAVGENESLSYPDAAVVSLTLVAQDGLLSITDETNHQSYEGSYRLTARTPKGADYEITLNDQTGYATVAPTTYSDGEQEPTLPISLGEYSLYFYAS